MIHEEDTETGRVVNLQTGKTPAQEWHEDGMAHKRRVQRRQRREAHLKAETWEYDDVAGSLIEIDYAEHITIQDENIQGVQCVNQCGMAVARPQYHMPSVGIAWNCSTCNVVQPFARWNSKKMAKCRECGARTLWQLHKPEWETDESGEKYQAIPCVFDDCSGIYWPLGPRRREYKRREKREGG